MPHGSYSYPEAYVGRWIPRNNYDDYYNRWTAQFDRARRRDNKNNRDRDQRRMLNDASWRSRLADNAVEALRDAGVRLGEYDRARRTWRASPDSSYVDQQRLVSFYDQHRVHRRCVDYVYGNARLPSEESAFEEASQAVHSFMNRPIGQ